jgi:hypothetical protein
MSLTYVARDQTHQGPDGQRVRGRERDRNTKGKNGQRQTQQGATKCQTERLVLTVPVEIRAGVECAEWNLQRALYRRSQMNGKYSSVRVIWRVVRRESRGGERKRERQRVPTIWDEGYTSLLKTLTRVSATNGRKLKGHGRGRETAQTPAQGLLFRQENCGGGSQQQS